jgi:hypothetical protein
MAVRRRAETCAANSVTTGQARGDFLAWRRDVCEVFAAHLFTGGRQVRGLFCCEQGGVFEASRPSCVGTTAAAYTKKVRSVCWKAAIAQWASGKAAWRWART